MVAAARMTATDMPAVLPEPVPQGGLARRSQRVGAHAHHSVLAVCPHLARLEEEVDALPRPAVCSVAVSQTARPAQVLRQLVQRLVEPPGSCPVRDVSAAARRKGNSCSAGASGLAGTGGARGAACGYLFRRQGRRTRRLGGMALARADGQGVPGCGDREPECRIRPGQADTASRDRPPQRGSMRHRAAHNAAAAYLGNPVP